MNFEIIINIFGQDAIPYALEYFKLLVPSGAQEANALASNLSLYRCERQNSKHFSYYIIFSI